MSRTLVLSECAAADIIAAADWYHGHNPQLQAAFLATVDEALIKLRHNQTQYQVVYRGLRRAPLTRFPYALFYIFSEKDITVIVCIHGRRRLPRISRQR